VQLVARHVDAVARADLVGLVSQGQPSPAGDDHDAVIVGMALARRSSPGRDVEVADPIVTRPLGGADQLVLLHAGDRRIVVARRLHALPGVAAGPAVDASHREGESRARRRAVPGPTTADRLA
jgi:hypothetical protein